MTIRTILFILCMLTTSFSHASFFRDDTDSCIRTYVQPSQLHIFPEGIFYESEKGIKSVGAIFCDEKGIFVMDNYFQCPGCHKWNYGDNCLTQGCPFYMKD